MSALISSRRKFLTGLGAALVTAPAIVRAASLMPVKVMPTVDQLEMLFKQRMDEAYAVLRQNMANSLYGDLVGVTRKAFAPRLFAQYNFTQIADKLGLAPKTA